MSYYPAEQSLFVAFKEGLFRIDKKGLSPVMVNKTQVYATSLMYVNGNMFIGTINSGLLILTNKGYKNFSVDNGLFSNSIYKLKPIGSHLWILGSGPLQLFDLNTLTPGKNYEMPSTAKVQVSDIAEVGNEVFVTTFNGVVRFPLKELTTARRPRNYLLSVKINDEIYNTEDKLQLQPDKNNILFKIGIPVYSDAKNIYIQYCLVTGSDSSWRYTEPGERTVNFSSLMPGNYTFHALAVDPRYGSANSTITIGLRYFRHGGGVHGLRCWYQ